MSNSAVITLPFSGLELADISVRFYREGVRAVAEESEIALTELVGGVGHAYLIEGPAANGQPCALTWWISGQGGALEYGFEGTPPFVVLPARVSGETVSSLSLRLFQDTTEITSGVTFTLQTVGDNPTPDLLVSGWSLPEAGNHYLLLWTLGGTTYQRSWHARNITGSLSGVTYTILEITASQRPLSIGLDDNSPRRDIWAVNFLAQGVSPIDKWDVAMAHLLDNLGLSSYTMAPLDIFTSRLSNIPSGTTAYGPYTFLADTGGSSPREAHDSSKIERLSLQITTRASSTAVARARINQIYSELDGLRDITISVP
jgi:hypothetical protein